MKLLYFDLGMGAAGDMLTAALLELLPDRDSFLEELNLIGLPEVSVTAEPSVKCGITGTHVSVRIHGSEEGEEVPHDHTHTHEHDHDHTHAHGHHHAGLTDVEHIISHLAVSEKVREDALNVYRLIAEAESRAHGKPVPEIHFHEVGTMDAIADVTAVCMLMEKLNPDKVVASPVHVGSGHVRCAHGIMPVPAPATAYLLQGIPTYGGGIDGELCTPTGAALLKHFVDEFGGQPVMRVGAIGYGMGRKDFPVANCLRAFLGTRAGLTDSILELSCNVDDMTAEEIGFAMDRLFDGGALDVFTQPIGMKKSRPGTWIRVICTGETKQALIRQMFLHTTTIGIRETAAKRYVLNREIVALDTPWGALRRKDCSGYGVSRSKFEYEDLARIARERNMNIDEAAQMLRNAGF